MRIRLTPMRWFLLLALVAIGLALGLTPDPAAVRQLHTSPTTYRLAIAALLIPYVVIWYVSFYAFAKLREYSRPLKDSIDGLAFHRITIGMGTLAFSLIVPTIIALVLGNIASHEPSFKATSVIIGNYLGLFPGLIAFWFLGSGARMLIQTTPKAMGKFDIRWHAPWFFLLSVVFSHLAIENHYRWHPYHLNLWPLIITFIVPYLYAWMVGLLAAYELGWYAKMVKGLLYKQAVRQFSNGIAVVIFASITIQFVNVTLAQRLGSSLGGTLLVDYVLLIVAAVGLILMALGTKKLKRIEEI